MKNIKTVDIPDELKQAFKSDPKFADSFARLTLSKKREYAEYIAEAKREETIKQTIFK